MIRRFWMMQLALLGLKKSRMAWAQRWLGDRHSIGLIQRAEQMDPAGRLFLLSISLCALGFSTSKAIGTYSTSTENSLDAKEISVPNLDANKHWPSGDRSHATVSSESTS